VRRRRPTIALIGVPIWTMPCGRSAAKAVGVIGLAQSAGELVQPERGVYNIESVDTDLVRAAHDCLTGPTLAESAASRDSD
jgi:hypothetical protein